MLLFLSIMSVFVIIICFFYVCSSLISLLFGVVGCVVGVMRDIFNLCFKLKHNQTEVETVKSQINLEDQRKQHNVMDKTILDNAIVSATVNAANTAANAYAVNRLLNLNKKKCSFETSAIANELKSIHLGNTLFKNDKKIYTFEGEEYINIDKPGFCHDIFISKDNFPYKAEIIQWIQSDEFRDNIGCSVFINSLGIINVVNNGKSLYGKERRGVKIMLINNELPKYIHFGKVDGDFKITNTGWSSEKNRMSNYQGGQIEPHKITSLYGCPKIVNGNFIAENIGIESLIGSPDMVEGNFIVKKNSIKSFEGMPQYIGKNFDISDNELTDDAWDFAKNNNIGGSVGDIIISKNLFVKYRKELF